MNRKPFAICAAVILAIPACGSDPEPRDTVAAQVSCTAMPAGWVPATAVSPDLVPPCHSGSAGKCPGAGYRYVKGTGWCKPA